MKRAGPFLEDIRIFLSGFSERDEMQLQRVLQSAGAKRMNQIAASVTHIGKIGCLNATNGISYWCSFIKRVIKNFMFY